MIISVLYHAAAARSVSDRMAGPRLWNDLPKEVFQFALLANISKRYCFLLHKAAAHM